jgi:hypothetical protein
MMLHPLLDHSAALSGAVNGPPYGVSDAQATRQPSAAALVTAFVQSRLTTDVLTIEAALATVNQQLLPYCRPIVQPPRRCAERAVQNGDVGPMIVLLSYQAAVLTAASHDVASLPPPPLGSAATQHVALLLEDVSLCADQAAGVVQEMALAARQALSLGASIDFGYEPTMRRLLTTLRRAEAWLETIDQETGARVRLPGFQPGAPSLESQLAVP